MVLNSDNQFSYAQATDVGCVRELNEDSIYSELGLWLLADGMGGHACGEIASALAIEEVRSSLSAGSPLDSAIQASHKKIIDAGNSNSSRTGMGTTIVALSSDHTNYQLAWVGDSRAYLWDKTQNDLTQISEDHSLMVRLINAGLISEQDALTHPQRHMITQCLGSVEIEQVKVDQLNNEWQYQQQILLCSDGLSDEVSKTRIAEIMAAEVNLDEKCSKLIESAKNGGGKDNISVIIIDSPIQKAPNILSRIQKRIGY